MLNYKDLPVLLFNFNHKLLVFTRQGLKKGKKNVKVEVCCDNNKTSHLGHSCHLYSQLPCPFSFKSILFYTIFFQKVNHIALSPNNLMYSCARMTKLPAVLMHASFR